MTILIKKMRMHAAAPPLICNTTRHGQLSEPNSYFVLTIHCFLRSTLLVDRSCVGRQPSSSSIANDAAPSGWVNGARSKSSSASNLS